MKKKVKKIRRACPCVDGERTSFVQIGRLLGCDRARAAEIYKSVTGDVTWKKLHRADHLFAMAERKERARLAERDQKIIDLRHERGFELADIVAEIGGGISIQRVQQIAGPLQ